MILVTNYIVVAKIKHAGQFKTAVYQVHIPKGTAAPYQLVKEKVKDYLSVSGEKIKLDFITEIHKVSATGNLKKI